MLYACLFLLTRLLRGATYLGDKHIATTSNFYSHASYEARLFCKKFNQGDEHFYSHASYEARPGHGKRKPCRTSISTHTPLARRDSFKTDWRYCDQYFYSHASCEARPFHISHVRCHVHFYSHASCEARLGGQSDAGLRTDFYSHAPCGARPLVIIRSLTFLRFLLTRPMRGATEYIDDDGVVRLISTHTPHAGRDISEIVLMCCVADFYSHAPCGARLKKVD